MFLHLRVLILSFFFLVGCNKAESLVQQYGGMRDALRMGNTQSRISFEEISSRPHAFAVGALTDLKGEITILDGQIVVATTEDGLTAKSTSSSGMESATLLTLAYIEQWTKDTIPTGMSFEEAVEEVAKDNGINTDEPFPFYALVVTKSFEMHVINGFCPVADPELAPSDQPWRRHGFQTEMLVVGFFAKNQQGFMTHHGSRLHIHGIDTSGKNMISGHLDSIEVMPESTIFLPAESCSTNRVKSDSK